MLRLLKTIANIKKFVIYDSELVLNSGFKIFHEDSDSILFEFPNSKHSVYQFFMWGKDLIFSDPIIGEYYSYNGNAFNKIPYSVICVIDSEYALALDGTTKWVLMDKHYQVVWEKVRNELSGVCTYCVENDTIIFLVKDGYGIFSVKSINRKDGSLFWEISLKEFDFVYLIESVGSELYLQTNKKLQSNGERFAPVFITIDMQSGEIIPTIDFNKKGLPKSNGFLKFDHQRSRFIYPTYEIDFEENCYYRNYLLDSNNVPATIGSPQVGIWNSSFYIDCYNKDSTYDESKFKETYYPYEIMIFDRDTGELISKTIVNDKELYGIIEFKMHKDKLYALDGRNNLRIYDFSEYK